MNKTLSTLLSIAVLAASALPATSSAQDARPLDLQVQQFRPMPGQQNNYFHTARASTPIAGTWEVGLVMNYARNPLVIQSIDDDGATRTGRILTDQYVLDLLVAVSVTDWMEVGLALPIYLYDHGNADAAAFAPFRLEQSPNPGLGDLRIVPRFRFYEWGGDADDRFALGGMVDLMLPTHTATGGPSERGAYQGEDTRIEGRLAFDWQPSDRLTFSANGGYLYRTVDVELANISAGDSIVWGAAAAWAINDTHRVLLVPEVTGAVSYIRGQEVNPEELPLEIRGGAKWFPENAPGLMVEGGLGAGLIEGFGTPDLRVFAGVSYSREPSADTCFPSRYPDEDGDRMCETPDNYGQECDICRPRTDGDYPESYEITDYANREDAAHYWRYGYYPGMSTDDGLDVDADGVPDACDLCLPMHACDARFRTDDDADTDLDGIPDGCDLCPDGSDLSDVDGDCIVDCLDECPEDPETWNGDRDEDGCPEEYVCPSNLMCPEVSEIPIVDSAYGGTPFFFDYDIFHEFANNPRNPYSDRNNEDLLDQIALILIADAECLAYDISVVGNTDTDGDAEYNRQLGLNRAEFVAGILVERLVALGTDPATAEAMVHPDTAGELDPLNPDDPDNDYAPGNSENRRVIVGISGCREIGDRGPEEFPATCAPPSVGRRCE